jgi:hypothetical protein
VDSRHTRFKALEEHSVDSARLIKGTIVFLVGNYLVYGIVTVLPGVRDLLLILLLSALWLGFFEFVSDVLSGLQAPLSSVLRAFRYARWRDFTDFLLLSLTFEFIYTLRFLLPYLHQQEMAAFPLASAFAFFFGIYPAYQMQIDSFGFPRFLMFLRFWLMRPTLLLSTALRFWTAVVVGLLVLVIGVLWGVPYAVKEALIGLSPLRTPRDSPVPSS